MFRKPIRINMSSSSGWNGTEQAMKRTTHLRLQACDIRTICNHKIPIQSNDLRLQMPHCYTSIRVDCVLKWKSEALNSVFKWSSHCLNHIFLFHLKSYLAAENSETTFSNSRSITRSLVFFSVDSLLSNGEHKSNMQISPKRYIALKSNHSSIHFNSVNVRNSI